MSRRFVITSYTASLGRGQRHYVVDTGTAGPDHFVTQNLTSLRKARVIARALNAHYRQPKERAHE